MYRGEAKRKLYAQRLYIPAPLLSSRICSGLPQPKLRLQQADVAGVFGILPPDLYHTESGLSLDSFFSHQFLRHYKWAIDFDNMKVIFVEQIRTIWT